MKKRLLTLGAIATTLMLSATPPVTYVGGSAKFYVAKDALVYSGGQWKLDSDVEKTVENRGNVIIVGDYVKGARSAAATDGKEFLNVYTSENDYGQVKILNAQESTNARMTMQKPAASNSYFGASYAVAFPYKDDVAYLMKSFGLQESDFLGSCAVDVFCGSRYNMTLTKWNNNKIHHDAVPTASKFSAGDYYNLNLRKSDMQEKMTGIIPYKGTPDGRAYTQTAKGVIYGLGESEFSNLTYNEWKVKANPYNEKYESYMGYVDSNSRVYNKNVYRFGNPYTSNLDLSAVEGDNAWLKILNTGEKNLKEAYAGQLIKNFAIRKRAEGYDIDWSWKKGNTHSSGKYHVAKFDGTQWTGSAEALLIRPLETFNLHFPALDPTKLGSRVLNVKVSFTDKHKTFAYAPSVAATSSSLNNTPTVLSKEDGKALLSTNATNNFKQLELFLVKNNEVLSSPAYIVGTDYYKESGSKSIEKNKLFVYGVEEDKVAYHSQKSFNEFNLGTYIAKPLGIGFNDLVQGETYELAFNLYEGSIFNKVEALVDGVFFLKDNLENKVVKIDTSRPFVFTANGDVNKRFEVYWKEAPQSVNTPVDTVIEKEDNIQKTIVYKDGAENKVRFENDKGLASIKVYNAVGGLLLSEKNISTGSDYVLNLNTKGMYVVEVIYKDGTVRILKFINH